MSFFSLTPRENQQIEASSQFWISCIYVFLGFFLLQWDYFQEGYKIIS